MITVYLAPMTNFSPATDLALLGRPSTPPDTAAVITLELVIKPTGVGVTVEHVITFCSTELMVAVRAFDWCGHLLGALLTMVYEGWPPETGFSIWNGGRPKPNEREYG